MRDLKSELRKVKTEELREPKRIYHRPVKREKPKKVVKLRSSFGLPSQVVCKVCGKKIPQTEAVLVLGGGTQGHRDFYMCLKHQ